MADKLIKVGGRSNTNNKEYIIDSVADLDNLDKVFGTIAICLENNTVYVLQSDLETWAEFEGGGASGSKDHNELTNRDAEDQHPISAISGLQNSLNEKADKGSIETFTISVADWQDSTEISPFAAKTQKQFQYQIGTDTIVTLVNNNPIAFANCGFVISSVIDGVIEFWAMKKPAETVTLTVTFEG